MPSVQFPLDCIKNGDQLSYQFKIEEWIRDKALKPLRNELTKLLNKTLGKNNYGLLLSTYVVSRFAGSWYRIFEQNLSDPDITHSKIYESLMHFGATGVDPGAFRTLLIPAQEQYHSSSRKDAFLVHPDLKGPLWIQLEANLKWDDGAQAEVHRSKNGTPICVVKTSAAAIKNWRLAVAKRLKVGKATEIQGALEKSFLLTRLINYECTRSVFILPYRKPVPYYEIKSTHDKDDIWLTISGLLITQKHNKVTDEIIDEILKEVGRSATECGDELWTEEITQSRSSVFSGVARETLIRDACRVEEGEKILNERDRNKDFVSTIKDVDNDTHVNEWKDPKKSKFLWASPAFHQLLEDLKRTVDPGDDLYEPGAVGKVARLKPTIVFIYGRPGTGKENLAYVLHLLSGRASRIGNRYKRWDCTYKGAEQAKRGQWLINKWLGWPTNWKRGPRLKDGTLKYSSEKNYFGAAATAEGSFSERFLRGERPEKIRLEYWPGYFRLAHATAGTLFLDEFNTLRDPAEADKLLRVLADPRELHFADDSTISGLNVLLVVASNEDRDQLLKRNFNEAVIGRITAKSFRIPSLVERPEDVALFVLKHLTEFNKTKTKDTGEIKKVDPSAMRLLCELDWPNNYRDLNSVLSFITDDRKAKHVINNTLAFEEVLTAVNRLQILTKGS